MVLENGIQLNLQVFLCADSILRSMDQGMLTGSVFIDLKKAFDTVDHDLIIEKLFRYVYGIRNYCGSGTIFMIEVKSFSTKIHYLPLEFRPEFRRDLYLARFYLFFL